MRQREGFFCALEGREKVADRRREGRRSKRKTAPRWTTGIWMKFRGGAENTAF